MRGWCFSHHCSSGALRNAPSLSASMPRREKGNSSSSMRRAAITEAPSRLSSGRHSLQPVAISVATRDQRNRPSIHLPQWATRSISSQPASFTSPQPLNVRTGVRRCTALRALGGRRQPLPGLIFRTGAQQTIDRGAADREQLLPHLRIEGQVAVALQGLQQ